MSTIHISAQELSFIYTNDYSLTTVYVILFYDWLLCLGQEVKFIWNWSSQGITISSLVYICSRYTMVVGYLLSVVTIYPTSDLSCRANVWTQTAVDLLGLVALSAFSALRAYALSNRSIWLATIIVFLAVPPMAMHIVDWVYQAPVNLPSPLNCSISSSLPPTLFDSIILVTRGSQFAAELLVIGITWWYTYQSYRLRRGTDINLGKTVSSILLYNGSLYFLFLATLYILDIIFGILLPEKFRGVAQLMEAFIDPVASILTCRFMLSLREFNSTMASMTLSGWGPVQLQGHVNSMVLDFAARPSESLPHSITSFAHPVHVDATLFEIDELDGVAKDESADAESAGDGCDGTDPQDVCPDLP